MKTATEFQSAYIDMYRCLREYIWGYNVVSTLADIEIETYTTFPDIDKLRKLMNKLYLSVKEAFSDDEELQSSVDAFKDMLDSYDDSMYAKLSQVKEA